MILKSDDSSNPLQYLLQLLNDETIDASVQQIHFEALVNLYSAQGRPSSSDDNYGSTIPLSIPQTLRSPVPVIDPSHVKVVTTLGCKGEELPMKWMLNSSKPIPTEDHTFITTSTSCSIDRSLSVFLHVSNPLQIEVTVTQFTIECDPPSKDLDISTVDTITLSPKQSIQIEISMHASKPDEISIIGAKFMLANIFLALHHFSARKAA